MKHWMICVAMLVAAFVALPAFGGPEGDAPKGDPHAQKDKPDAARRDAMEGMKDDELRDIVSTILMVRVSRNLELNDEQTVVLVKHLQEMRDEISKLYEQRDQAMTSLRESLDKDGVSDDELNAKLKEVVSIDEKRSAAKREAFENVSTGLTPKQKAKLYVTLQDFEGQMRRMMARAREMGEDALRERFHDWERGDGPPHGAPDRSMMKPFMKNRRPGPPPADGEAPPPPPPPPPPAESKPNN